MSLNQPYLVLKENTQQLKGKDALKTNIEAIKAIAETIRTTLGPKGLNKMLVDSLGDITITSDGSKILEELSIDNPTAKMIVDLAKTIHKNVGDGSSSVVLFIGALMDKADEMISMNLAPTIIYEGYLKAIKFLKQEINNISKKVTPENTDFVKSSIVQTALRSKSLMDAQDLFTNIIVDAISKIQENRADKPYIDLDNIQIIKKEGEGLHSTRLVDGIIIDKEVVSPILPKTIQNAKIALLNGALEIVKTDFSSEIQISDPEEIQKFLEQEENMIRVLIESIHSSGANVVFCQKGIDETAQHFLSKYGILAVRRVKNSDMQKIAKATGAKIVTQIKDLTSSDLGTAGIVSERKIGGDNMVFIEHCHNPKAITILVRGGTETGVNDAERSLKNGLSALKSLIEVPRFVGGGGSIEIELRKRILQYAEKVGGKQQISIESFADALEIVPTILIENSGNDPLDILTSLRSQVDYSQNKWFGFDAISRNIVDVQKAGIIDSMEIKWQIYNLATELAVIFIRIDDYIKAKGK
ncbi:MAG: thermosome subunit [Candidatus Lokiarchaeota archaeon]|nr:thermosome subunit [Candidatus Harpocratesius repetitus]